MFDNLIWQKDRLLMDGLVFRLEHYKADDWELGDNCFKLIKLKPLIDQYVRFFLSRPGFSPLNTFELGIWDGGSIALWFEQFHSAKHVAIDLQSRSDSPYFRKYVEDRGLSDRVKSYWNIDQSDAAKLRQICENEFAGPLDLVLDDASHIYEPTKASFEALFPLLRPGGLYIIEDWAWGHWKMFHGPDHPMSQHTEPTNLIFELVQATGTSTELIAGLTVFQGFTVVERGGISAEELRDFKLQDHITTRSR